MENNTISINKSDCIRCGSCVGACSTEALTIDKDTFEVIYDESKCIACGQCIAICPLRAIKKVS